MRRLDRNQKQRPYNPGKVNMHSYDGDGAALKVVITPTATKRFALEAAASDANLTGTKNPVTVRVSIGNNSGTTSVKTEIQ
jgi:hypothetical protein